MRRSPDQDGGRAGEARHLRDRGDGSDVLARYGAIDQEKGPAWDDLDLVLEVARAQSLAGNPAKVELYFLRCAELNPRRAALYHCQIGWFYHRKKRWGRALSWYDRALATFPGYHLCLFRKGYCLERLHRPRGAVAALQAAVASYDAAPADQQERSRGIQAQVLFHLARSLREIGQTADAREALDRCAAIDTRPEVVIKPEHRMASYGATYLRDGDAAAAIRCLEEARDRDARSAVIWERLGLAYAQAGRIEDAERALELAVDLPKGAVALISLGRFLLAQRRFEEAARALGAALVKHPQGEVQIRIEIAELHRRLGRPRAALDILEKLASGRVPPQSTLAVTIERKIAEIHLDHGASTEAIAHLRAALEHDPEDVETAKDLERLGSAPPAASGQGALVDAALSDSIAESLAEPSGREPGRVASYFQARGFGFISYATKEQTIFFHVSHVDPAMVHEIRVGCPVTFVVATNSRNGKPQAEDIRLEAVEVDGNVAETPERPSSPSPRAP